MGLVKVLEVVIIRDSGRVRVVINLRVPELNLDSVIDTVVWSRRDSNREA
jgi:hypothetical protein